MLTLDLQVLGQRHQDLRNGLSAPPRWRAWTYALGAMGKPGVTRMLDLMHQELDLTTAFCGRKIISQIDRTALLP